MQRTFTISSLYFFSMAIMAFAFIGGSTAPSKVFSADGKPKTIANGSVVLADAHPYLHCHNLPKRTLP
jgi:hypothetical protein